MGVKKKTWNATPEQIEFIRKNYGIISQTKLMKKFKVSRVLFTRFLVKHKIRPIVKPKRTTIENYTRVPVPCESGKDTYLLVPPHRCPIEAKEKYMAKQAKRKGRKPWQH